MESSKKSSRTKFNNVIIFVSLATFVLIVITVLAILLIFRGLGSSNTLPTVPYNLSANTCPQELVELDGETVGVTEGHIQRMTTEDYNWVQKNCVFNSNL
ncbi:MAG: hypothetical protein ACMG57_02430 [Candidatus Dojkabacteria bacterium]